MARRRRRRRGKDVAAADGRTQASGRTLPRRRPYALAKNTEHHSSGRNAMGFGRDLLLAIRNLRRAPGFTVVAALTLALGMAATTTMYSVVDAVLLRPLAFAAPEQLVDVAETSPPK